MSANAGCRVDHASVVVVFPLMSHGWNRDLLDRFNLEQQDMARLAERHDQLTQKRIPIVDLAACERKHPEHGDTLFDRVRSPLPLHRYHVRAGIDASVPDPHGPHVYIGPDRSICRSRCSRSVQHALEFGLHVGGIDVFAGTACLVARCKAAGD